MYASTDPATEEATVRVKVVVALETERVARGILTGTS